MRIPQATTLAPKPWLGLFGALLMLLTGCGQSPWNNPYPPQAQDDKTLYGRFSERPKHFDPVRSYSSNEYVFIQQIYEPPLQYHYLRRPYELVPLTVEQVPKPVFLDRQGMPLPDQAASEDVAFSLYRLQIKPGIMYQPHPAFARSADGAYRYHTLTRPDLADIHGIEDFQYSGSRELVADDFVHQIKRMGHPHLHCPIAGLMMDYIVGLAKFADRLKAAYPDSVDKIETIDLGQHTLEGVTVIDKYRFEIRIKGKYPQFVYWLAMPFFAPMPWEAERFYGQDGMDEKNINLDWYPVGTGPFMLTENNPNRRIVLVKNPNFRGESYPTDGSAEDRALGLLEDSGRQMPFIEKAIFSIEKETIPAWNKFLQGYYDNSGIGSDSFDQAIQVGLQGDTQLTEEMQARGIQLLTAVETSSFYMGFNMLDDVVGGDSERARKLRQALSIAIDYEEFISIFANGRGLAAQGPLPPGIFGHREDKDGINPYVYEWLDGRPQRKPIEVARRLLAEAGYPDGREATNSRPLVLNFDTALRGPDAKANLDWIRKQFQKLGIKLVIRSTDYNRFQDKMLKGTAQIFQWGWNADYPDPENFLFLLYGPHGKVEHQGENAANYASEEFDRLFDQVKNMSNGPERQGIIDAMVEIARRDAPWIWGMHPVDFSLHHSWYHNAKPMLMSKNTLKYKRVDPIERADRRTRWNPPILWPLGLVVSVLALAIIPAGVTFWRKERAGAR